MVGNSSKDLLKLEPNGSGVRTTSSLESKFLFCSRSDELSSPATSSLHKPDMFSVPKSQVLGKVKDFLGVISESNKKLQHDAKLNPDRYDIEVLGDAANSSGYIEMDLMLGVADLHTPEAVAAAEAAMAGRVPAFLPLGGGGSDDGGSSGSSDCEGENDESKKDSSSKPVRNGAEEETIHEVDELKDKKKKKKKRKRPNIVELS
ncbi:hypothetical protein M569_01023 [Genlisea aurea]|uniref:Uncharacterized protein n=1 Tax=Genlisea aurea TaxID=192259 RepID=S8D2W2_9LAMI|nr:hypothetical protein M569_01023 [Genlisea aurea]